MRKYRVSGSTSLLAAALLGGGLPAIVHAQERNLDVEPSAGKVVHGEVGEGGVSARFTMTLAANSAVELTAMPVGGSDPYLKVFDAASDELLAENDDSAGSLAAEVRLFTPAARRLRIEVSNAAGGDAMDFDLIMRPSDYRPRPVRDIALGQSLPGELGRSDEQLFRFRAQRGQLWEFALAQGADSSLDPALQVFAGERVAGEPLASDDDGGGELNALVRFLVPANGTYVVRGYGVGSTAGAYVLTAARSEAAAPVQAQEVELGRAARGALGGGTRERFYRLSARARAALAADPGVLVIDMKHLGDGEDALDPMLEVGFDTPLGFASLLSDDDGGEDSDARLVVDLAELGPQWLEALRIKASGFLDSAGDYTLTLDTGADQ